MRDDRILVTLRIQSWLKAKGELGGLLNTYWPDNRTPAQINIDKEQGIDQYTNVSLCINKFISEMDEILL